MHLSKIKGESGFLIPEINEFRSRNARGISYERTPVYSVPRISIQKMEALFLIEAIVRLRPPNNWMCDIIERYSAKIKVLDCMPTEELGGRGLVEIKVKDDLETDVITDIRNHPTVCNVDLSTMHNGKILGAVATNQCAACHALTASDCFLVFANSCEEGEIEWKLQTGQRKALFELLQMLRDLNYEVELISLTGIQKTYNLTPRQEEMIRFALKKGYFDCPKKTNIREIAQTFGISISTVSEILRRGIKKVVSDYFNTHQMLP